MKTLKKISVLFALLLLSSGVFAQSCDLTINDPNNTSGTYYDLSVELWHSNSLLNTEPVYSVYVPSSGTPVTVSLTYQLAQDMDRLKFHIYAQNLSTLKWGWGWSQQTFDSDDYYYNSPLVTVPVP